MENTNNNILEIKNLHTYFYTDSGVIKSVDGVDIELREGSTLGIVGESGSGKSVTALSVMGLLMGTTGKVAEGEILFEGRDLTKLDDEERRKMRGEKISMIFQEPMTTLNPVFTIGDQLCEVIGLHNPKMDKKVVETRALEALKLVGIVRDGILKNYPHELSGGMRQRVVIAMALACNPQLVIADEPTTALDVTIQAQILDLLRDLKDKINASIMLITHDLGVVAEMADYVVVMYAGRVVEQGTAADIFHHPAHPYTIGLMKSRPMLNQKVDRLYSIPGNVPNPVNLPEHCYFKNRCESCIETCNSAYPKMVKLSDTHMVSCYLHQGAQLQAEKNGKEGK